MVRKHKRSKSESFAISFREENEEEKDEKPREKVSNRARFLGKFSPPPVSFHLHSSIDQDFDTDQIEEKKKSPKSPKFVEESSDEVSNSDEETPNAYNSSKQMSRSDSVSSILRFRSSSVGSVRSSKSVSFRGESEPDENDQNYEEGEDEEEEGEWDEDELGYTKVHMDDFEIEQLLSFKHNQSNSSDAFQENEMEEEEGEEEEGEENVEETFYSFHSDKKMDDENNENSINNDDDQNENEESINDLIYKNSPALKNENQSEEEKEEKEELTEMESDEEVDKESDPGTDKEEEENEEEKEEGEESEVEDEDEEGEADSEMQVSSMSEGENETKLSPVKNEMNVGPLSQFFRFLSGISGMGDSHSIHSDATQEEDNYEYSHDGIDYETFALPVSFLLIF